jgi:MFS transporter, DHA2 family, multidrug resistance protein
MDCFHALGIITLIAAPLVLATKYFSLGGSKNTPAAH